MPARRFFRRAHATLSRPAARFFGAACTPRPISRAARRGSCKGAESAAQASRARLQARSRSKRGLLRKRRSKGAGRRRLFAADASARSKKDVGAKRTLHRRGGFSDGRTPHCLDRRRVFFGAACTPRPISRAARRGSRKRLVATASRCERACKRAAAASGAFCGKGGARERGDGGFFAADASARSKKDVGAKRTLLRRGGLGERI